MPKRIHISSRARPRRIGLAIDVVAAYGRGVLRGIMSYVKLRDWLVVGEPRWSFDQPPDISEADADGLITQLPSREFERRVLARGIPATNVSNFIPDPALPTVLPDDLKIGRLAAEYFRERGFREFGFCGPDDLGFSQLRLRGFAAHVERIGGRLHVCDPRRQAMGNWAASLPKPIAVLGCNDDWAHRLLNECRRAGVNVPGELAILGVDDDDLINMLVTPSLSSIVLPTERIGFEAARLLDRLMRGGAAPREPLRLAPAGVVTRQSTDVTAVADADVSAALTFIRRSASRVIGVDDVLEAVPVGRRSLERRFRQSIGRSILSEIRLARVERAKQLLVTGDLPMPQIAEACGFANATRLGITFRQLAGVTPSEYRITFRRATPSR